MAAKGPHGCVAFIYYISISAIFVLVRAAHQGYFTFLAFYEPRILKISSSHLGASKGSLIIAVSFYSLLFVFLHFKCMKKPPIELTSSVRSRLARRGFEDAHPSFGELPGRPGSGDLDSPRRQEPSRPSPMEIE